MELNYLKYFQLAYESGSIGKAAKRAFMTRQGLSNVLKALESELQTQLFIRSAHGLEPTEVAQQIYPEVCDILNRYQEILAKSHTPENSKRKLKISISYGFLLSLDLEKLRSMLLNSFPRIDIDLSVIEPPIAGQCVASGEIDLALVSGYVSNPAIDNIRLGLIPLCAVVNPEIIKNKKWHGIKSLQGLTWLGKDKDFPFDEAIERFSKRNELDLKMSYEWNDYHLILNKMRGGKGACPIPSYSKNSFEQEGLVTIPFDSSELSWPTYILVKGNNAVDRQTQELIDWFVMNYS